jgi:hypothetical protein
MSGTLSFKDKNDSLSTKLKGFLKEQQSLLDINNKPTDYAILSLGFKEMLENHYINKYYGDLSLREDRVYEFTLINIFDDDLAIMIETVDDDKYKVDWCMGNKNRNSNLEYFTLLLVDYMDSEFKLVYYDEYNTSSLNEIKQSLDNYVVEEDTGVHIYSIMNKVEVISVDDDDYYKNEKLLLEGLSDEWKECIDS